MSDRPRPPDGIVVVDKPAGWTSHDVVARARKLLGTRKVGHSGTLDPDATGVLLLGVGRATRLLRFLTSLGKSYRCEIVLGATTSTLDDSGEVLDRFDMSRVRADDVSAAAATLTGEIEQVPPMVSAVKVGGRRLHELARAGVEVEREARRVVVERFEVVPTDDPLVYRAEVDCSSGTYVRSLAADLGAALGGGAHLRRLRRSRVGTFDESEAVPLDRVGAESVLAPAEAMRGRPQLVVDEAGAVDVGHGRRLPIPPELAATDPPWAVLDEAGSLLAVYERASDELAKPAVVLAPAGQ